MGRVLCGTYWSWRGSFVVHTGRSTCLFLTKDAQNPTLDTFFPYIDYVLDGPPTWPAGGATKTSACSHIPPTNSQPQEHPAVTRAALPAGLLPRFLQAAHRAVGAAVARCVATRVPYMLVTWHTCRVAPHPQRKRDHRSLGVSAQQRIK